MRNLLMIFIGGGLGSCLRWMISISFNKTFNHFPLGVLISNVLGCFIISFLMFHILKKYDMSEEMIVFLTVGFCGGFTTLSTFILDFYNILQADKLLHAFMYLTLTLVLSLLAIILGSVIAKWIN